MPTEIQQPSQIGELLNDISYVNQISREEIEQSADRMRISVSEAALQTADANALIDELSTQLGNLTAKVILTEKAVQSLRSECKPPKKEKNISVVETADNRAADSHITTNQLAGNKNLYPVEISTNGISYLWSGADPEIQFSFSLDRSNPLEMQIRLFAVIKRQFLRELQIIVDGEPVKHHSRRSGGMHVISCQIPAISGNRPTVLTILLPATYSPNELVGSPDRRKLGIAINEIHFVAPESGFVRILERLRLKK
jgi:hypothetical protein